MHLPLNKCSNDSVHSFDLETSMIDSRRRPYWPDLQWLSTYSRIDSSRWLRTAFCPTFRSYSWQCPSLPTACICSLQGCTSSDVRFWSTYKRWRVLESAWSPTMTQLSASFFVLFPSWLLRNFSSLFWSVLGTTEPEMKLKLWAHRQVLCGKSVVFQPLALPKISQTLWSSVRVWTFHPFSQLWQVQVCSSLSFFGFSQCSC